MQLSPVCNIKDTEDQIIDQLLQAMVDSELTEKLLEIKNLTLVKELDKSRQRETTTAQAESMSASSVGLPGSVHQVRKGLYMHQQPLIAAESQAPPVYVLSSKKKR